MRDVAIVGTAQSVHARRIDDRNEVDSAQAGDIVALVGLKNVQTGHTLCDEKNPATLEPMVFPDPVISIAVAAKDKANAEKLANAIGKMIQEDPSFRVETDEELSSRCVEGNASRRPGAGPFSERHGGFCVVETLGGSLDVDPGAPG